MEIFLKSLEVLLDLVYLGDLLHMLQAEVGLLDVSQVHQVEVVVEAVVEVQEEEPLIQVEAPLTNRLVKYQVEVVVEVVVVLQGRVLKDFQSLLVGFVYLVTFQASEK